MIANTAHFTGREKELQQLAPFLKKTTPSLLVIKGRRRVGKSRLVAEFAKNHTFYKFVGLAPADGVTATAQRIEFSRLLKKQLKVPATDTGDWAEQFELLARLCQHGRTIILFDEISWMAHDDPTFLSKLKNVWEQSFQKNPNIVLILCGSISTWIEENIISSTGYFGRISWTLSLKPLPLKDCHKMLQTQGFKTTYHEIFKLLCVTGGIPWYLEQMTADASADENIQRQCFTKGGILVSDFDLIFHELFVKRDHIYKKIILALADKSLDYGEVSKAISYPKSGRLSEYLQDLQTAGFITKDQAWSLKTTRLSRNHLYRLSDNYLRFYVKYILPKLHFIQAEQLASINMASFPAFESIMGLQFENLIINNRNELYITLGLKPEDIVFNSPYFQRKTQRLQGCQFDLIIKTKINTFYIIEVKFSKNTIGASIINEFGSKLNKLDLPKNSISLPVLIHINGVSTTVENSDFFYKIINFSDFIK